MWFWYYFWTLSIQEQFQGSEMCIHVWEVEDK
jgi:hypothetical protein